MDYADFMFIALRTVKDPVDKSACMVPMVKDRTLDDPRSWVITEFLVEDVDEFKNFRAV